MDDPDDLSGRTLGDFHVLRPLGAGGMGRVYLARQVSLDRPVALKLLNPALVADPVALKRFEAEALAVARLQHPNVVQVYALGEAGGRRFMALEYVDGRNLREYLARKGPPELPVALSVLRQVAAALGAAHEAGLVHRDVKPENVLVTRKVGVKVADFGLSRAFADDDPRLTKSGLVVGTPVYLSPEQAQGKAVDHRSDLYSLGVTAYHLLAGEPPFRGETAIDVALKHVTDRPRPLADLRPDLPPDLCGLVHKLLAKDPNDRYQSAREVLRDLAKVRDGLGLTFTQTAAPAPEPIRPRWGRWLLAGAGCVLAAVGGAVAYLALHPKPPDPPAAEPKPGLPDVRPPEKPTTPRERELLALITHHDTPPDKWVEASIDLGLLYLRDRRPADAQARFEAMEKARLPGPAATAQAHLAGRLGRAVVLAHRDAADPAGAAGKSLKLFADVVETPFPKLKAEKAAPVQGLLMRHPDLGRAVAEALDRDAVNTGQEKLPPALEALRSPRGVGK
ncbi:MAG: serine/threonine protein kinase [Gemmataceae bacterium]|nr:serine/threonine protein kinase [Gemmataceae bacterium]